MLISDTYSVRPGTIKAFSQDYFVSFQKLNRLTANMKNKNVVFNVIAFNLVWIASVYGAASNAPLIGPIVFLAAVCFQLIFKILRPIDLLVALAIGLFGTFVDSILFFAEIFSFKDSQLTPWGIPLWLTVLWLAFGTTLRVSLEWLLFRPLLASFFGAVSGSLSYTFGASIGALSLNLLSQTFAFELLVVWALVTPLCFLIARYILKLDLSSFSSQNLTSLILLLCVCMFICSTPLSSWANDNQSSLKERCKDDVCFKEELEIGSDKLKLRTIATFSYLLFDVYTIALYTNVSELTSSQILSDSPKALIFNYHRDIEADQMRKGALDALNKRFSGNIEKLEPNLSSLHQFYKNVSSNDRYSMLYTPEDGFSLSLNNSKAIKLKGKEFAEAYFGIWLSDTPLSETLKAKLLGKDP